jgi:hypothetical protein
MKKYRIVKLFRECGRRYPVGTETVFDDWPEEDRPALIAKHLDLLEIEEVEGSSVKPKKGRATVQTTPEPD